MGHSIFAAPLERMLIITRHFMTHTAKDLTGIARLKGYFTIYHINGQIMLIQLLLQLLLKLS
jgi:hypothetical protein